jgi:hypothetical protein
MSVLVTFNFIKEGSILAPSLSGVVHSVVHDYRVEDLYLIVQKL